MMFYINSLGRFNVVFVKHYSRSDDRTFKIYEPSNMNEKVNNNDHEENTKFLIVLIKECVGVSRTPCRCERSIRYFVIT